MLIFKHTQVKYLPYHNETINNKTLKQLQIPKPYKTSSTSKKRLTNDSRVNQSILTSTNDLTGPMWIQPQE